MNIDYMYCPQNLEKVRRRGVNVTIGGVLQNFVIVGPDVSKLLFERCRFLALRAKKKKARKDFGYTLTRYGPNTSHKSNFVGTSY